MARLWSSGFELNSTTTGVELGALQGSPTIQTGTVRSGTYAGKISSLGSGVMQAFEYQFASATGSGPFYFRIYFYFETLPTAENKIIVLANTSGLSTTSNPNISIDQNGALRLYIQTTQVGSTSGNLTTNAWHSIEIKFDRTPASGSRILEARVDGAVFATSSTVGTVNAIDFIGFGGNIKLETQTQGVWYIDDIAINDSTGSFQNSYPGEGKIMHLRPNAAGDNTTWNKGAGSSNWNNVSEVTPDDATTINTDNTSGHIDDYNIDDTPAAIGASDTINVVQVGIRFNSALGSGTQTIVTRLKKASGGTVSEGSTITTTVTTWNTNSTAVPHNPTLTLYQDPDSGTWTKSTLDTTQIGIHSTNSGNFSAQVSTEWLLVDWTPAATTSNTAMFMPFFVS